LRPSWWLLDECAQQSECRTDDIAAESIGSNFFWPLVAGLQAHAATASLTPPNPFQAWPRHEPMRSIYRGEGFVAGRQTAFDVRTDGQHLLCDIAKVGRFWVDVANGTTTCAPDRALAPQLRPDFLLGPPMVLTLALRRQFCLHAAVVAANGRAVAIIGPSGAGKSTAARELAARFGWQRLADDVAPIQTTSDGTLVYGNFPQLKVQQNDNWDRSSAELVAVIELKLGAPQLRSAMLTPAEATLKFAASTMAARLFPPAILRAHLAACAALAEQSDALCLNYAHTPQALDVLGAQVAHWL
jgi:hypothetical protein